MENYKLPSYEDCIKIVQSSDAFYKKEDVINNQKVVIFDYRLASISDFKDNNAFELRGLTFVQDKSGNWKRFILLNKFFNVGETLGWEIDTLNRLKITEVSKKEDGSIISFIPFDDNTIRTKSKTSFISDQAKMAQNIIDKNLNLCRSIRILINRGLTPIFELVSPFNQIVVNYDKTELILLQIRDNETGRYLDKKELYLIIKLFSFDDEPLFKLAKREENTQDLNYWLNEKKTNKEDIEGWVLTFDNGKKAKIKTDLYFEKHHLIGPDAFRENTLITSILNDNIDDIISCLQEGEKKNFVNDISNKVMKFFNSEMKNIINILNKEKHKSRKEIALDYRNLYSFGIIMKNINSVINEKNIEDELKNLIKKKTKSLKNAQEFLKDLTK